jgi:hypothetical protein
LLAALLLVFAAPAWTQTSPDPGGQPPAPSGSQASALLVKLVAGLSPTEQAAVIARNGGTIKSVVAPLRLYIVEVAASDLATVLANYQSDPQVASVEQDKVRQSGAFVSDLLYPGQWALPKIGWDVVYGAVIPSGTAKVAILDTGVDVLHPDIAGKVFVGTSILDSSNGMTDPSGHGTWVAGIVAANTGNGVGIAGVASQGVELIPVTVLDANGLGKDSDVVQGVVWAADNGANVILMAFSAQGFSSALQDAIDYAWSKDVVLVAAVGNDGSSTPTFPAGHRGVIGVAATDENDVPAAFSNAGQSVFLAAPGVNIQTTDIGAQPYIVTNGTSASAAIVAGVAGFMKAVDPTLSNGVIVGRIARTADPAGTTAQTGNGRINMARALADTSVEAIQPTGADPVGAGGPFVGPYRAAGNVGVSGTVKDNLNNPISGATVSCTAGCNAAALTTTNASGSYPPSSAPFKPSFAGNGPATITLTASAAGFTSASVTLSIATNGETRVVNFTLQPADTTPPVITPNVSGTLGANGWYTSDVTVTWTVTDPESGIATSSGCGNATLITETTSTTLTCSATNGAGRSNSNSVTIKLDKTGPTATLVVTAGTAGTNGWYTSDVTVHASGTDSMSGPVTCAADQVISAETTGTNINGSCTNDAGLTTNAAPLTIKLDKTGPTATLVVTAGTAGTNGWYTSDVTVHTAGTDSTSSPVTCASDQFQTTETTGATFNGSCTNDAGLTTNAAPLTVKLDKTAPTASANASPGPNTNGWNKTDVTVTFNGSDTLSGIDNCTAPVTLSTEGAGQSASGICTDKAGNVSASATASNINIDKTAPTASASASPAPNGNGWNKTDVSVAFTGIDSLSGIDFCTAPTTLTAEGAGQTAGPGTCTDKAGNVSAPVSKTGINIDKTAPTASASASPGPNAHGWNKTNVTVSFSGSDGLSGIDTCAAPVTLSGEGAGQSASGTCTDKAGNVSAPATASNINIDKTAPTVSVTGVTNGAIYTLGAVPAAACSTSDALSGVATNATITVTGGVAPGVGTFTATCNGATDKAGNAATASLTYSVQYASGGLCFGSPGHQILQPINADGTSVFKQKSTVPAKFRVCDANGKSIGNVGVVSSFMRTKAILGTTVDDVDEAVDSTTPFTEFRWDSTDQQWIFNMSTKSLLANYTYYYRISLNDGTWIDFNFGLK